MSNRFVLGLAILCCFLSRAAAAQGICPLNGASTHKLVCLLPEVYGPTGLQGAPGPLVTAFGHEAHFSGEFIEKLSPINEAVGIQVSQLPLASPSSGFTYDTALKTFAPEQSLGPILGERSSTIGRGRLFVGFSYQYFNFDSIDGQPLNNIPSALEHQVPDADSINPANPNSRACPNQENLQNTKFAGSPCYVRDFIETNDSIDLRVSQYTMYVTFGITEHLDLSVAVPFLNVQEDVRSNATIISNSKSSGGTPFHQFRPDVAANCSAAPCLNASFSNSGSATGVGDIVLRGKYEVYKGERIGVAAGLDLRLPTGDDTNYLGSGATGVRPFGVVSYKARISPHAEVGYEFNGDSALAGQFVHTATVKSQLPNRFVYIVGADVAFNRRITGAFDLYGQRLFGAAQITSQPYTDLGSCSDVDCATLGSSSTHPNLNGNQKNDFNVTNASVGAKIRVLRNLVATGNVLIKLDDGGLRAKVVPLVGLSYSF